MPSSRAAHFYLVSTATTWKWGITTKPSHKARSSAYEDCFVWQEISSMSAGRCFEKRVGAIMTNILKEEQQAKNGRGRCRLMYQEDVEQDFPLHLLMEIVDHALNRITYEEDCEEYRHACIGLDEWDAPIPPLSASYRARLEEWRALAPSSPVQPEPMWA